MAVREDLIQVDLNPAAAPDSRAANGAPIGEPDMWDESIPAYNPHLSHTPEPFPVAVSPGFAQQEFDIAEYLAEESAKDLLRFSTAGSVDDGKSTLIGRLLYDTQSVYDDQIRSIEGKGTTAPGVLDLALLTDGLRAEREQGITIDVAYRYFSTPRRKFIIADTPGHEQYTRNMATGASTADVAIVLIDARKGVLTQSRRHAYITALLGVPNIIVAVNKMDLIGFDQATFSNIERDFRAFFGSLAVDGRERIQLHFVPVSALEGDNVVHGSKRTAWYAGASLLQLLESLPSSQLDPDAPFRMAVQRVVRPDLDFRGFAGQIASGTIRPGDRISVLPSGLSSRVERIVTFDGDLREASAPMSVTLTLADEIDISRGDLISSTSEQPATTTAFNASLVWMDAQPLQLGRRYLLKHTSRTVQAEVRAVLGTVDLAHVGDAPRSGNTAAAGELSLAMNGIGEVRVETTQPVAVDPYARNRHTGSFVLIDRDTNATVAAGMIRTVQSHGAEHSFEGVTAEERTSRFGHIGAQVALTAPEFVADALERALYLRGAFVLRWHADDSAAIERLVERGVLVLTNTASGSNALLMDVNGSTMRVGDMDDTSVAALVQPMLQHLRHAGVLRTGETV